MAAISHPDLYDALREAGASESRARAAEHSTLPAARAAEKSEVRERVKEEVRPLERTNIRVWATVSILTAICIAILFFSIAAWMNAKYAADSISELRAAIGENTRAIARLQVQVEANAQAIAENRAAIAAIAVIVEKNSADIAENRAAIEANSQKLDELIRLFQASQEN